MAQYVEFIALFVQSQHAGFLGGQRALQLLFTLFADLVGGVDGAGDLACLGLQLGLEGGQFHFGTLGLRVVLAQVAAAFLQLGVEPGNVGLQALDDRALHHLGHGVGLAVLAFALAVGGLALDAGELA